MSLIDSTYFINEISIPSSDYSDLSAIITRYEKEILMKALGYDLYKLVAAYNSETSPQRIKDIVEGKEYSEGDYTVKWNGLVNSDKVSMIAYYVFYWWLRVHTTNTTTSGEMQTTSENAEKVSPAMRLSMAWNNLRELYGYPGQDVLSPSLYNFLTKNTSDYSEWVWTDLGSVNMFDL